MPFRRRRLKSIVEERLFRLFYQEQLLEEESVKKNIGISLSINMLGYLSADICSDEKQPVFQERAKLKENYELL